MMKRVWPPFAFFLAAFAFFEIGTRSGAIPNYLLPAPTAVVASLFKNAGEYAQAAKWTLTAAVLGLALSALLGVGLSLLISSSPLARRALYPYAVFFQTVPLISIAPILVIWFGFGLPTVVAAAVIASIFPVIANTLAGLWATDRALLDLFKLYGASRKVVLFKLRLPFARPYIFTGVKIASGLSMIGAIVGEFIAGGGLGGLIDAARNQQRLDKVFAAVMIASFSGIVLIAAINVLELVFLKRWKSSSKETT